LPVAHSVGKYMEFRKYEKIIFFIIYPIACSENSVKLDIREKHGPLKVPAEIGFSRGSAMDTGVFLFTPHPDPPPQGGREFNQGVSYEPKYRPSPARG
jgi:hypothetical protein